MNWALFALVVIAVLTVAWIWQVVGRRWSWAGLYASLGCLIAAGFNAAAPVRGLVDPDYVGYRFGLVAADRGVEVTLLAGAIFLSCAVSALLAASRRAGPSLWIVAAPPAPRCSSSSESPLSATPCAIRPPTRSSSASI